MIRTRFAPSPTGHLHVGGARTALFNYLYAKATGGRYILRIEDTDQERSTEESQQKMLASMKWLGLDWDEGPEKGGPYGPYIQSQRLDIYQKHIQSLLQQNKAYKCFCTPQELEAQKQRQQDRGEDFIYEGTCRHLTQKQTDAKEESGLPFTIRLKVEPQRDIQVTDLVQGEVTFSSDIIGDFIIQKSDGFPTYNFAVVVDDYLMAISHVIRGVGHLSNTPRQILIAEALGFPLPYYAHVSQIVGPDRKKLSKRHGATSLKEYQNQGFFPEALVNYLSLLGWSHPQEEEFLFREQLEQVFDINRCNKADAVFDTDKLTWLNGKHLRQRSGSELAFLVLPFLTEQGNLPGEILSPTSERLISILDGLKDHMELLAHAAQILPPLFQDNTPPEDNEARSWLENPESRQLITSIITSLEQSGPQSREGFFALVKEAGKEHKIKGKQLFMPLRIAMTGAKHGPELPLLYELIGHERTLKRMRSNL